MKRSSTLFLRFVILLIAFVTILVLIRFPQIEGRAEGLDLISIYRDPFIIYIYIAFIPFFIALYQSFRLLGYIDKNKIFSQNSIKAVRNIKYSAFAIVSFIAVAEVYLFITQRGKDDIAGGIAMGILIIFVSTVIATGAAVFQKLLQNALEIKSENDLTV